MISRPPAALAIAGWRAWQRSAASQGHHASKGVFVTTSGFSSQAVDYVRHLPQRVILIDGDRFADLMIEHGVGVRVSRTVEVKRIDEDFFLEE